MYFLCVGNVTLYQDVDTTVVIILCWAGQEVNRVNFDYAAVPTQHTTTHVYRGGVQRTGHVLATRTLTRQYSMTFDSNEEYK
jgi:riboflavin synthase alpha subunit